MSYPVMPLGFLGSQGDNDSYRIERSLRFNSADSAYLNRTPASAGNRKTWTWSGWVKRSAIASGNLFSNYGGSGSSFSGIRFETDHKLLVFDYNGSSFVWNLNTSQVFRDSSAWFHIVVSVDTTQATSSNRVKIYSNGSEITSFSTANYPSLNLDTYTNSNQQAAIGSTRVTSNSEFFDGYLTEINFIDGQALTPSSFGETDAITGRWKAKAYSGTYGTNGFYLKFADNSGTTATTLGKDSSGNGNNWTPNNFSVTAGAGNDSLVDSPTNYGSDAGVGGEVRGNYCTLNPLDSGAVTLANGNLDVSFGTSARGIRSSIGISSGKYYFEMTVGVFGSNGPAVGIAYQNANISSSYAGSGANAWVYNGGDGKIYNNNAGTGSNASYTTNDIIGVAVNMDSGTVTFYKNNSVQPTTVSGLSGTVFPVVTSGGVAGVQYLNFGQRPFAYTAPSGFKALCTTNLPTPTIQKPSSYMDVVTYTGDGTSSRTITGLNFQPELIWIKNRTNAYNHTVVDSVRGGSLYLETNNTNADQSATVVSSFNSNGFQIGTSSIQVNGTSNTYVAWAWDEAPIAGMDIVSYTGNGANRNISHSLGVAPKMIIVKQRSGSGGNWPVYHTSLPSAFNVAGTQVIYLNLTNANAQDFNVWNSNNPSATQFSLGTSSVSNANSETYIAYLFAEVEGFSRIGSYTGNGSADGPFVWCGFRPRYVMIKRTDVIETWITKDTARSSYNGYDVELYPNSANSEGGPYTPPIMDYISNGFKLRNNPTGSNASGGTYIFAAFAESPFKYARAR